MSEKPQVTQVILDGKILAEVVRRESAKYARDRATLRYQHRVALAKLSVCFARERLAVARALLAIHRLTRRRGQ